MGDDQSMDPTGEVVIDPPFIVVHDPAFTARFALGADDEVETVDNVDAFVDLPDGSTWTLTIFTVDEVRRILDRWKQTGEVANGSYFWGIDDLIVPQPGIPAMVTAIRELVRSNEITAAGIRIRTDDQADPDPPGALP